MLNQDKLFSPKSCGNDNFYKLLTLKLSLINNLAI